MSALHRAVLRCYPRWWREQHGEEALGLLLDSAGASGRTDPRDLLNLAAHAARVRFTQAGPPTLIQGIRNRVSVIAAPLLAAISSTFLIFGEWAPWDPQTSMVPSPIGNLTTGSICFLAGLLAALAAALGRATAARWLAAFSGISALAIMLPPIEQLASGFGFTRPPGGILGFTALIAALAALGEPRWPNAWSADSAIDGAREPAGHSGDPGRARSRGLVIFLGALPTIGALPIGASALNTDSWFFYRSPDQLLLWFSAGILLGIGLLAIAVTVLLSGGSRAWATALAVNSMPWLLLFYFDSLRGYDTVLPLGVVIVLVAVIGAATLIGIVAITVSRRSQSARNSVASSE
ncbi:hypothetical protein [Kribbella sp. CA-293567]|uniref:hypothetical protein n=1 Tax=Kribbella sp. CA-293567 TaxID=3002436 RepID=UPI0022DD68AC|nr:hypothetical protein [Kribbella sp. CA-293567]WBQ05382.1 hypothetical protein OX958_00960 [Kribbella sp. CA-293567]